MKKGLRGSSLFGLVSSWPHRVLLAALHPAVVHTQWEQTWTEVFGLYIQGQNNIHNVQELWTTSSKVYNVKKERGILSLHTWWHQWRLGPDHSIKPRALIPSLIPLSQEGSYQQKFSREMMCALPLRTFLILQKWFRGNRDPALYSPKILRKTFYWHLPCIGF